MKISTKHVQRVLGDEEGAILVQVAIAILVLTALATFVVDHGVLWVSRGQAQNAADAGALSGAIARAYDDPTASNGKAFSSAMGTALANQVWTAAPTANVTFPDLTGPSCTPLSPVCPCPAGIACVRVDVYRNGEFGSTTLPTIFGKLLNISSQGVRATANARVGSGNLVIGLLPFAVMDRWADNYDPAPVTTYFPNDGSSGTAGWTPNDAYEPTKSPADVYIAPYNGNTNHTGWKVTSDYGRQLILKDGSVGNYSTGWSQMVCLTGPANCSASDVSGWLTTPSSKAVGIAKADNPCTVGDEQHGCIDIKTGSAVGPVTKGVEDVVAQDPSAAWNATANGGKGAVTGGQGMASPRIRGIVVLDINHYIESDCSGSTCVGKVANIIGFFLEGICKTVKKAGQLDPGLDCDDPTKDIVGRIVTLPGKYAAGTGGVEDNASFLKVIQLVR